MNLNIAVKRIEMAPAKEKYQAIITNHGDQIAVTSPTFDTGDMLAAGYALDIVFTNVVYYISKGYRDMGDSELSRKLKPVQQPPN